MDTEFSKHLFISKTQNISRLKGKPFTYHLKHFKYKNLTRCGITGCRKLTYTEAHNSSGMGSHCVNCTYPGGAFEDE